MLNIHNKKYKYKKQRSFVDFTNLQLKQKNFIMFTSHVSRAGTGEISKTHETDETDETRKTLLETYCADQIIEIISVGHHQLILPTI